MSDPENDRLEPIDPDPTDDDREPQADPDTTTATDVEMIDPPDNT